MEIKLPATRYNFNLEKGTFFRRTIKRLKQDGTPYDLNTGWRGHMQVRNGYAGDLIVDMSTDNNRIFFVDSYIRLFLDYNTVAAIPVSATGDPFPVFRYYYDLYIYNDAQSIAKRFFYGDFNVRGGMTT